MSRFRDGRDEKEQAKTPGNPRKTGGNPGIIIFWKP